MQTNDIGIYTRSEIDPGPLEYDLCNGHVLKQTCIKRYDYGSDRKSPMPYVFIIHPLPKEFRAIYAYLNILGLDEEHKELLKIAIEKEQTHVQLDAKSYPVNSLTLENGLHDSIMVHNIESYHYQKFNRDVIIKLVQQKSKEIYYQVIYER